MFKLRFMASRVLKTNKLDMSFPFGASSSSIQLELWQITVLCHRLSPVHIAPSTEATMHCNNLHFELNTTDDHDTRIWIPRASSIIQRAGFIVLDINRSFCFSECDLVVEVVSRDTEGFYLADRTNHNQSKLRRPTDGVTYSHSNLLLCSPSFPLFHLFDFTPFTLFTPAALTPSFGQLLALFFLSRKSAIIHI